VGRAVGDAVVGLPVGGEVMQTEAPKTITGALHGEHDVAPDSEYVPGAQI
jgi:hypothetical protein